jgi:hypothetical protein
MVDRAAALEDATMNAILAVIVAVLPTTWIVDAANGPGTNFIDLPAAVAAAVSGDTIIVRPGSYTAFNVTGKALTIQGAGALVTSVTLPPPVGSSYSETRIDAVSAPAILGFPIHLQAGVLDSVAGQIRASNGQVRILQ